MTDRHFHAGDPGDTRPNDEAGLVRWAFFLLLLGTFVVLTLDFRTIVERNGGFWAPETSQTAVTVPVLPPAIESDDTAAAETRDPRDFLTTDPAALRDAMRFTLLPGGILQASGSIDQGAAARFEQELIERGEYVRTVTLDSPGGSLDDAMAMSKMIRDKGLMTEVRDGALCASSCPLVLAGGTERRVADKAAVGLHQFYAVTRGQVGPEQAMADAQMTTARITRHLIEMGVDGALWLHALDTPPRKLYYLSASELSQYRLVTDDRTASLRQ